MSNNEFPSGMAMPTSVKTLDPLVTQFLMLCEARPIDWKELQGLAFAIFDHISFPLLGPLFGAISGLSQLYPGQFPVIPTASLNGLEDRPAFNDYLMAMWQVTEDASIIPRIVDRTQHSDEMVSMTARWMIGSVNEGTSKFAEQLAAAGYQVERIGLNANGRQDFRITKRKVTLQ